MAKPDVIDPDWERYPNSILKFTDAETAREGCVDLRRPVTAAERELFRALALNGSFAVLTADDPAGKDLDPGTNRRREAQLESELRARGIYYMRVAACAADESHCEQSVAAKLAQADAVALAGEFDQVAIFWFDGESFWIVGVIGDTDPIRLPRPT